MQSKIIREVAQLRGVEKIIYLSLTLGIIFFIRSDIDGIELLKIKTICNRYKVKFKIVE
jgi:hypothetical protein